MRTSGIHSNQTRDGGADRSGNDQSQNDRAMSSAQEGDDCGSDVDDDVGDEVDEANTDSYEIEYEEEEEEYVGVVPATTASRSSDTASYLVTQAYIGQIFRIAATNTEGRVRSQVYRLDSNTDKEAIRKYLKLKTAPKSVYNVELPLHTYQLSCPFP